MLGAIDEIIHGGSNLHGWRWAQLPDQTLLRVRGFNPSTNTFLYSLNARFGSASPATTPQHAPFRITLDLSVDAGPSREAQALEQNLRLRPALVGSRAPVGSIKNRYLKSNFTDFYGFLLVRLKDSLALSIDQMRKMEDERQLLRGKADSMYLDLAKYLAALPDGYDRNEPLKRITEAADSVWARIDADGPFLVKLLNPAQVRLLPQPIFKHETGAEHKEPVLLRVLGLPVLRKLGATLQPASQAANANGLASEEMSSQMNASVGRKKSVMAFR